MKIKLISLLAANLTLTAPCLNAGLDSWISSILPEPMRVSEKNRNHFDQARTIMGIKRPVIVMNTAQDKGVSGFTENFGLFSRVCINEYTDNNPIYTIYHEMGHVYHNHHAASNALLASAGISWGASILAYACKAIKPARLYARASLLALIVHAGVRKYSGQDSLDGTRIRESEAQEAATHAMAKAGHIDLLNDRLNVLLKRAQIEGGDMRTRGEEHFTIDEEIAMIRAALEKKPL